MAAAPAAAAAGKKSLWLAKKKFDLSRDFPHLCHATAPPPPPPTAHSLLGARCSSDWPPANYFISFGFASSTFSFTVFCSRCLAAKFVASLGGNGDGDDDDDAIPASCSSGSSLLQLAWLGSGLGESSASPATGWQQTTLVLSFSLILSGEIELKFTFLIICVACDAALICLPLPFPLSCRLFYCISDSFARCQLIRCAFAFN